MRRRITGWLQWLFPGVGVKRWLFVALVGMAVLIDAIARWFIAEGSGIHVNEILDDIVDDYFSPAYLTLILGIAGSLLSAASNFHICAAPGRTAAS